MIEFLIIILVLSCAWAVTVWVEIWYDHGAAEANDYFKELFNVSNS